MLMRELFVCLRYIEEYSMIVIIVISIIYVEQARRDETVFVTDEAQSLANDIRLIEEQGVYHLLCSIRLESGIGDEGLAKARPPTSLIQASARRAMLLGCGVYEHQAPVDNRNSLGLTVNVANVARPTELETDLLYRRHTE